MKTKDINVSFKDCEVELTKIHDIYVDLIKQRE